MGVNFNIDAIYRILLVDNAPHANNLKIFTPNRIYLLKFKQNQEIIK